MLRKGEEIRALGAAVILVAYDDRSRLDAKILRDLELPFPLVLDPGKRAYTDWGLGRTSVLRAMLSPTLNWRYLRLLLAGERFLGFAPDMLQLGGDFVVGPAGTLTFAHRMRNSGDRAPVPALIAALGSSIR